jgi:hypothetical protein
MFASLALLALWQSGATGTSTADYSNTAVVETAVNVTDSGGADASRDTIRRFVHRHAGVGAVGGGVDHTDAIACVEESVHRFALTPEQLWCNKFDCINEFNRTYELHRLDCSEPDCRVLIHCADSIEDIEYACLLTVLAIAILLCGPELADIYKAQKRRKLA